MSSVSQHGANGPGSLNGWVSARIALRRRTDSWSLLRETFFASVQGKQTVVGGILPGLLDLYFGPPAAAAGAVQVVGSALVQMAGNAIAPTRVYAAGVGNAAGFTATNLVMNQEVREALQTSLVATVSWQQVLEALRPSDVSYAPTYAAGSGTGFMAGGAILGVAVQSAGAASVQMQGAALASAAASSLGSATVQAVGGQVAGAAVSASGEALVQAVGASAVAVSAADVLAQAGSIVLAGGGAVVAAAAYARGEAIVLALSPAPARARNDARDGPRLRREFLRQQDEQELLELVPYIMREVALRSGHYASRQ